MVYDDGVAASAGAAEPANALAELDVGIRSEDLGTESVSP